MSAIQFIESVIRVRSVLISSGKSKKDSTVVHEHGKLKKWYMHWHPNEKQVRSYIKMHSDQIRMIMPGTGSASHQAFENQLNEIVNEPC
jgi:hypothetical protein